MNQTLSNLMFSVIISGLVSCGGGGSSGQQALLSVTSTLTKEELGEKLFSDKNLSQNRTQSCATCHDPDHAFIDSRENLVTRTVSIGDDGISLGDRNSPTLTYLKFAPSFQLNGDDEFFGGQFRDGQARDLKSQAFEPPINPVELGMPDKASVISRIQENSGYIDAFEGLFGVSVFDNVDYAYAAMAESISAFEKTELFSSFDSKYDRWIVGEYTMTPQEELGLSLFFSPKFTRCNSCHQLRIIGGVKEESFTDFRYHNLGIPVNQMVRTANNNNRHYTDLSYCENKPSDLS